MLNALVAAPRLEIVSFDICLFQDVSLNGRSSIDRLVQSSALQNIVCRGTDSLDESLKCCHSAQFLQLLTFRKDTPAP